MATEALKIIFSGRAVRSGTISVHDLGTSLIAFGDLCQEANRVLNQDRAIITVNVKSEFTAGSFHAFWEVIIEGVKTLIETNPALDEKALLTILGVYDAFGNSGLLQIMKFSKGEEPTQIEPANEGNSNVSVKNNTGSNITVNNNVINLFESASTRDALERMVGPLSKEGIDRIKIGISGKEPESINKEEANYFSKKNQNIRSSS